tara:strand:- start:334 stop:933 length:600 start_codon:yes stop_codon:yes gene_type:complete
VIVISPLLTQHHQHDPAGPDLEKGQSQPPQFNPPLNIAVLVPPQSLRCNIIRPTLAYLGVAGNAAENLLLGTLLTMAWLPTDKHCCDGIGPYAISASVHTRLWDEYLALHPDLASLIRGLASQRCFLQDPHAELAYNLGYATAIAWMLYQQQAVCLDDCADMPALAQVWQLAYPHQGASARDFISSWNMTHGDQAVICS